MVQQRDRSLGGGWVGTTERAGCSSRGPGVSAGGWGPELDARPGDRGRQAADRDPELDLAKSPRAGDGAPFRGDWGHCIGWQSAIAAWTTWRSRQKKNATAPD